MSEDNKWHMAVINGIGLCGFWGRREPVEGGWLVENVTCIVVNPQTGQPALVRWTPQANMQKPMCGAFRFDDSAICGLADVSKEFIEKANNLWSDRPNQGIIIPSQQQRTGLKLE